MWTVRTIIMCAIFGTAFVFFAQQRGNQAGGVSLADFFGFSSSTLATIGWIIFIGGFVLAAIWMTVWVHSYSFEFLPEYIMMKRGVISRSETHLPYRVTQDVIITRSIFERLFGLATVRVENAAGIGQGAYPGTMTGSAGGMTFIGQPFAKANELAAVIRSAAKEKNSPDTGL